MLGLCSQALKYFGVIVEKLPRTGTGRRIRLSRAVSPPVQTVTTVTETPPDSLDWAEIAG